MSEITWNINDIAIEPGKTYAIECKMDTFLNDEQVKSMIEVFREGTGAKAIILNNAKLSDSASIPAQQLGALMEAIQRVRELHEDDSTGNCTSCMEIYWTPHKVALPMPYPCPTIKALDGHLS